MKLNMYIKGKYVIFYN